MAAVKKGEVEKPQLKKKKHRIGTILWRTFWVLTALCIGGVVAIYITTKAPDPAALELSKPSTVYFSDGTTEIGHLTEPTHSVVPMSGIAETARQAVIASQDPQFQERPASTLLDSLSGLWESLWGGVAPSHASLTNKYVEELDRGSSIPIVSQLHRMFLPVKIDQTLSKDQILADYMNTAYFGRGAYGIESAAQAYFGGSAAELSLPQSALLAAIMPAPSSWDPAIDGEQAKVQYKKVLAALVAYGAISQEEADAAEFPAVQPVASSESFTGTNGYLLAVVRDELNTQARIAHEAIDQGSLRIVSSFDAVKQQSAVDAVTAIPQNQLNGYQTGLISLNPKTGEIVAMYGGADYAARSANNATSQRVPSGSPFKTFTLMQAFEDGISPDETFFGSSMTRTEEGGLGYANADSTFLGEYVGISDITKVNANAQYVQLGGEVGVEAVKARAVRMGIPEDAPGMDDTSWGYVLGGTAVTAQEMARAYGALANSGKLQRSYSVKQVFNAKGTQIYEAAHENVKVLSASNAATVTQMLRTPFNEGGTAYENGHVFAQKRPSAGQTSLSTDPYGAWFVGYTPQFVTAVVMYQLDDSGNMQALESVDGAEATTGEGFPLQIWSAFMDKASANLPVEDFK